MAILTATRGLPASGKSTWARRQQELNPNLWRVNRDDARAMLRLRWPWGDQAFEDHLTAIQTGTISHFLGAGYDVIVDDTNLAPWVLHQLATTAKTFGADFVIQDFTDVPVEECITRDAWRVAPVGEEVIRRMHRAYLALHAQFPLIQWHTNGDHPGDRVGENAIDPADGTLYTRLEGAIVRFYRHPLVLGTDVHTACGHTWHDHGWIDDGPDGIDVCPGSWVGPRSADGYIVFQATLLTERTTEQ